MINFEEKVYNAKIKFSYLGKDEYGKLCYQLGFDYENGRSALTNKKMLNNINEIDALLNVLELKSWEEVARKFARVKIAEGKVVEIGNLIDDRWVRI